MSGLIHIYGLGPDDTVLFAECNEDLTEDESKRLAIPKEEILFICSGKNMSSLG